MSRHPLRFPLAFVAALPWAAAAQMNAPLTGAAAARPTAPTAAAAPVAPAVRPVPAPAAPTAPTAPAAAAAQPATQAMPERAVVRQMQTPMPAAPAAPAATASAEPRHEQMGDVTRGLLAAQADGRRAGGALPILGPVSSAAWNRYLESFRQPIPQWFTERVKTDSK